MSSRLLILETGAGRAALLSQYCRSRGYRPEVVPDVGQLMAAWRPDLRVLVLSMSQASADGVEAIRYLATRSCNTGLVLTSAADPRILSAASRLARARGLRVIGTLREPYRLDELGALLLSPEPEVRDQSMVVQAPLGPDDLSACLGQRLVQPWFQPKICVRSLRFVAVETLVRLEHPEHGVLRPSSFLPMIEGAGMIARLTEAVSRAAFRWCAHWQSAGLPLQVAVNISPLLLSDLDLPDTLVRWADDLGIGRDRIILEITEAWLAEDSVAALDTLTRLRLFGFQLSIDDFGTGYANMSQLNDIPYGEMKLDQSFVRNAGHDEEARTIVQASIELGHRLGMRVVAEGVERQEDWDLISELGCDEGQGYFLARPMRPDRITDWLDHWNACLGGDLPGRAGHVPPIRPGPRQHIARR
jgi:EAL domain-containing protein (putative c-di-GMP-specific phosphodiesterase class I)